MSDNKPSGIITEVQIYFKGYYNSDQINPRNKFKGIFIVDKIALNFNFQDFQIVQFENKKWEVNRTYSIRLSKKKLYLYLTFDEKKFLEKVSVGIDKKE